MLASWERVSLPPPRFELVLLLSGFLAVAVQEGERRYTFISHFLPFFSSVLSFHCAFPTAPPPLCFTRNCLSAMQPLILLYISAIRLSTRLPSYNPPTLPYPRIPLISKDGQSAPFTNFCARLFFFFLTYASTRPCLLISYTMTPPPSPRVRGRRAICCFDPFHQGYFFLPVSPHPLFDHLTWYRSYPNTGRCPFFFPLSPPPLPLVSSLQSTEGHPAGRNNCSRSRS